jgi:hypothetical protein
MNKICNYPNQDDYETEKEYDEAFSWITNSEGQLMAIMDLLDTTECRNKEGEMFLLADKIVRDM